MDTNFLLEGPKKSNLQKMVTGIKGSVETVVECGLKCSLYLSVNRGLRQTRRKNCLKLLISTLPQLHTLKTT